jgi:hypothetical protein
LETVALVSSPRISINKPKVYFFSLFLTFALFILLSLAGRGGEEWGRMISGGYEPERSKGLFLPVFWCGTGKRPRSGEVKPRRWGWMSFAPLTEALHNKHCWPQSCVLDILNIDPAGRGGRGGR